MQGSKIATVYQVGHAVHSLVRTTPGRDVAFRGGAADIRDERDMPHMLRLSGVQIEVEPQWIERLPDWVARCPTACPPKARVVVVGLPGYRIGGPPDYAVQVGGEPPHVEGKPKAPRPKAAAPDDVLV